MSRDAQFSGFAKLLFDELYDQFSNLRNQEEDMGYLGRDKEAEQTRKDIQETIARRAWDLVDHSVCWIATEMGCDHAITFVPHRDVANCIPDFTKWLKEKERTNV